MSLMIPALAGEFFTTVPPGKPMQGSADSKKQSEQERPGETETE